ncbi:hypothetical protein EYR38_007358 [Pleurotus pulmonarius]|nr:hypothetical protein EYR38_007358 [Pleurotus pulmonarius]
MVHNNIRAFLLACSIFHTGMTYASSDNQATGSDALRPPYETLAVRDIDYMTSFYAREPEPESAFWEHEARDLEGDDDHNAPSDSSHNHSTREVDEDALASDDNHHQRRAALDYVMELAARSLHPDEHKDERLARREQLNRIVDLAARYAAPQSQFNDYSEHDNSRRGDDNDERLEARSGQGTVLPSSKALGNAIQQWMANNMHRREQADDEGALFARDLHDEVHNELDARSAFGMAFRPIAQELGRAFRTAILEKVKRREVEELEVRSAFGMAFRPIAQELGRAFRTAVLEKIKREIEDREEVDGVLESREDVAVPVESAFAVLMPRSLINPHGVHHVYSDSAGREPFALHGQRPRARLHDVQDRDPHPRSGGEWECVATDVSALFTTTTNRSTGTFERLHPLAASHNLRTVALNRTEYPGSSKYTDAELEELKGGDPRCLERTAVRIAFFIAAYIQEAGVTEEGGVVVVGWSIGTVSAMAPFSFPEVLPLETYDLLNRYVTRLVLYDPPYLAFGLELPGDTALFDPWGDATTKSPEEVFETFKLWVSSYFDVPEGWSGSINELDSRKRTERATVDSWNKEEHERFFSQDGAARAEMHWFSDAMQKCINRMATSCLFDEAMNVRSPWHTIWAAHRIKEINDECVLRRIRPRPIEFVVIPAGNHFVHWDEPQAFLRELSRL